MVQIPSKERGLQIIDTLFQQLLAIFVLLVLWEVFKNYPFSNVHTWHVVLCTLGFALCMAEALMLFNKENSFLKEMDRNSRATVHGVVMFLACVCITTGISLKINQKSNSNLAHFTSTHAILGLVSWILTFIAVLLGLLTASANRMPSIGSSSRYKIIHLFIGVSAYVIGVVALGFGLDYLVGLTGTNGRNALIVFLALYVAYSLIGPIRSCYNYFFG